MAANAELLSSGAELLLEGAVESGAGQKVKEEAAEEQAAEQQSSGELMAVGNFRNVSVVLPSHHKTWDMKMLDKLNTEQQTFMCTQPSMLSAVTRNFKKYRPMSELERAITRRDEEIVIDNTKLAISKHVVHTRDPKKGMVFKKFSYRLGLKRMGGVKPCYYWDKCSIRICRNTIGSFLVVEGHNQPDLVDVLESVMGSYFYDIKRQNNNDPITIGGEIYVNIPSESSVNYTMFLSKFFVLEHLSNTHNITNNSADNPFVLKPMTKTVFNTLFYLPPDRNAGSVVELYVAQVLKDVSEMLDKSQQDEPAGCQQFNYTTPPHLDSNTFSVTMESIMFVYVDSAAATPVVNV